MVILGSLNYARTKTGATDAGDRCVPRACMRWHQNGYPTPRRGITRTARRQSPTSCRSCAPANSLQGAGPEVGGSRSLSSQAGSGPDFLSALISAGAAVAMDNLPNHCCKTIAGDLYPRDPPREGGASAMHELGDLPQLSPRVSVVHRSGSAMCLRLPGFIRHLVYLAGIG